jgi:hypothetical protein
VAVENNPGILLYTQIRKSPYFYASRQHGVRRYSVYNHTYHPRHYGDPVVGPDVLAESSQRPAVPPRTGDLRAYPAGQRAEPAPGSFRGARSRQAVGNAAAVEGRRLRVGRVAVR